MMIVGDPEEKVTGRRVQLVTECLLRLTSNRDQKIKIEQGGRACIAQLRKRRDTAKGFDREKSRATRGRRSPAEKSYCMANPQALPPLDKSTIETLYKRFKRGGEKTDTLRIAGSGGLHCINWRERVTN